MIRPGLGTLSFYGKYGESFSVVMLELMGGGPPNRVAGEQATKQSSRSMCWPIHPGSQRIHSLPAPEREGRRTE